MTEQSAYLRLSAIRAELCDMIDTLVPSSTDRQSELFDRAPIADDLLGATNRLARVSARLAVRMAVADGAGASAQPPGA